MNSNDEELIARLAEGDGDAVTHVLVNTEGTLIAGTRPGPVAVFPGSFNPLHDGHRLLAAAAREQSGREVLFELSVTNVDKPPLSPDEVLGRLAQFKGQARVLLTRAPRFVEKAQLLPGTVFVVGWDTFIRLLEPRYYDDEGAMRAALHEIADLGCRFLVAGRAQGDTFRSLADTAIPPEFESLFEPIPEARFRLDISSTALRGSD